MNGNLKLLYRERIVRKEKDNIIYSNTYIQNLEFSIIILEQWAKHRELMKRREN